MPHQLAHHPEAGPFRHVLDRMADVAHVVAHPRLRDPGGQRILGHLQQPLGVRRDLADRDGGGRIGVETLELHANVHAHDASLREHPRGDGNAVHDLLIDRDAEGLGKAVETLEGRGGPVVAPDEPLRGDVEILGRQCPGRTISRMSARVPATMRPALAMISISRADLSVIIYPSACRTRAAISSTVPMAGTRLTPPRRSYQSRTGAVCWR